MKITVSGGPPAQGARPVFEYLEHLRLLRHDDYSACVFFLFREHLNSFVLFHFFAKDGNVDWKRWCFEFLFGLPQLMTSLIGFGG